MLLYWRMGWRNIWRNKRRSAITISALALSVALLIFFIGMNEHWMNQMEENVIGLSLGAVQVHHPLYLADQNLFEVVEGSEELVRKLGDNGYPAAARCYGYGLVGSDRTGKSAGARLKGVFLEDEPRVTTLHLEKYLYEGRYLSGRTRRYTPPAEEEDEGTTFEDPLGWEEDEVDAGPIELEVGEMVLGKKLAASLGAHPGDTVNLVTMAADGTIGNELFDVVGVFKNFGVVEDRSLALVTLADYQRLFKLPAGQVHELALRVPETAILTEAKAAVQALVGEAGKAETWKEIVPAQAEMMEFSKAAIPIWAGTMYLGAGLLIMNAMLMMVFERIREFGVMKALGLKGRQLIALVYFETFWMCVLAALVGAAVGVPFTLWVGWVGIDLSAFAPDGFALSGGVLDPVMYAEVTPDSLVIPLVALFGISFVSVLYPAIKAAVIEPVKAIYYV
ncbi:MAG: ABC transporter permease [bacterium]|nr:ABC transporter permease [bacterium]